MVVECPWLSAAPMAAPMCISGPSGPTGRPLATTSPHDTNLTASVATLNSCGRAKNTYLQVNKDGTGDTVLWCMTVSGRLYPSPLPYEVPD